VLPTHYVIVDDNQKIVEITSNTPDAARIKVYIGSVKSGNEMALTHEIKSEYDNLLNGNQKRYGVLYKSPAEVPNTSNKLDLASILPLAGSYLNVIKYISF